MRVGPTMLRQTIDYTQAPRRREHAAPPEAWWRLPQSVGHVYFANVPERI